MPVVQGGTDTYKKDQPVGNGVNDFAQFAHLVKATRDVAIDPVSKCQQSKEPTARDDSVIGHEADIGGQHGETNDRNQIRHRENRSPRKHRTPSHLLTLVTVRIDTAERHSLHS